MLTSRFHHYALFGTFCLFSAASLQSDLSVETQPPGPSPDHSMTSMEQLQETSQEPITQIKEQTYRVVLEPLHRTTLDSDITSTVEKIAKKMGESFEKGDLLMALDKIIFEDNYNKTLAVLTEAKSILQAQQRLYKDKATSEAHVREAAAATAGAEAEVAAAKKALDACTLLAPYKGKVQDVYVQEFERVAPGQKLIEILDDSQLIAKLFVPADEMKGVSEGKQVTVILEDMGKTVSAVIQRIAPSTDPSSSLIKIDAIIDNAQGQLRAGMIGTLTF